MSRSQISWHILRTGLWRGFLASLIGSVTFGVFLTGIYFANEALTRNVWPVSIVEVIVPFAFAFGISIAVSLMPGLLGGIFLSLSHCILKVNGYPSVLTSIIGFFIGVLAGYLGSVLAINNWSLFEAYSYLTYLVSLIAGILGLWVGRKLVLDYETVLIGK